MDARRFPSPSPVSFESIPTIQRQNCCVKFLFRCAVENYSYDIAALEAGVHDYIRYYNHERIKLDLQGLSPVEYWLGNTA